MNVCLASLINLRVSSVLCKTALFSLLFAMVFFASSSETASPLSLDASQLSCLIPIFHEHTAIQVLYNISALFSTLHLTISYWCVYVPSWYRLLFRWQFFLWTQKGIFRQMLMVQLSKKVVPIHLFNNFPIIVDITLWLFFHGYGNKLCFPSA